MQGQVEHSDESLLNSRLAISIHQGFTETGWRDGLENHRKKLRVKLAHVAQGDSCWDTDSFVPLYIRLLISFLVLDVWFIHLHHEDTKNSLNCFLICKSVACRGTLRANIFKSLASIKPDNLIRLLFIKTLDNDINSIITELPDRVCHLIIKLRGSIEHVLP